jgi:carboxyl-terminal processing protease
MALLRFLFALFALGTWAQAANADYAARFEAAWRLVDERYWDPLHRGLDWQAVREIYEPLALAAESDEAFYEVLEAMYREIGDDHSVFVPPQRVEELRERYGDLPCLGIFSQAELRDGSVDYRLLEGNVGYIRLPDLAVPGRAHELRQAVRSLKRQRAQAFILDLRGNPGGRLVEMMQAAGVFTSGFLWRAVTRWTLPLPYPALGAVETDLPLVVLVDADVHSAAEGLAGGLQAHGRATVIGETSAGNVEAVLPFCFRDGSQAWIATGVLAPLRGATWEDRGVEPDIPVPAHEALDAALAHLGHRP